MITPVIKSFAFKFPFKTYYQFRISLRYITPEIWRRIQVPDIYTFWDLHVAIQDAMEWKDCHLHQFTIRKPKARKETLIGIPDIDDKDMGVDCKAGWKLHIADFFTLKNNRAEYQYDFGDNWEHIVELEEIKPKQSGKAYPRCVDGKRACPPDDCGGVTGYGDLLRILKNPKDKEYGAMQEWLGKLYHPDKFNPAAVLFDNPWQRLKQAVG